MEFAGAQLVAILEQQWADCLVRLVIPGVERGTMPPAEAARMVSTLSAGGFWDITCAYGCRRTRVSGALVGVGHRKRIMYLKPCDLGMWRGRKTTERPRNENGEYIGTPLILKHVGERIVHGSPDPEWTHHTLPDRRTPEERVTFRPGAKLISDPNAICFRRIDGDKER